MDKLSERTKLDIVIDDDIETDKISSYVDATLYKRARARMLTATVAQTKVASLQFFQATDSGGSGSKALGSAVTETAPTGGAALDVEIDVDLSTMDTANGFKFVAVKAVTDDTTVNAAVALELEPVFRPPV